MNVSSNMCIMSFAQTATQNKHLWSRNRRQSLHQPSLPDLPPSSYNMFRVYQKDCQKHFHLIYGCSSVYEQKWSDFETEIHAMKMDTVAHRCSKVEMMTRKPGVRELQMAEVRNSKLTLGSDATTYRYLLHLHQYGVR